MNLPIFGIFSHFCQEYLHFLWLPAQDTGEECHGEAFKSIKCVGQMPHPERFHILVLGPRIFFMLDT